MGNPVRFDALREAVRVRYDLPTFSTTTFITTAIVNALINKSVQAYFGILQTNKRDEYLTYDETISATASAATFDLSTLVSAKFLDVRALHWLRSTNEPVEMHPGTLDDLHMRSEAARAWGCDAKYVIARGLVYWLPTPSATYSVRIWYTGLPTDLSSDSDTIDGGPGWDEWVVEDVCAKIAIREEKDPRGYVAMRNDFEERITDQKTRNRGEAKQVRDSRGARLTTREARIARRFPYWS